MTDIHHQRLTPRRGCPIINAVSESWFATFKAELIHTWPWSTLAGLRRTVFDFIESSYNTRLHSSLGYRTPTSYNQNLWIDYPFEGTANLPH